MMKGLKIVSDGSLTGTRIYTADGEDVTDKLHVRQIEWKHKAGGLPEAVLTCSISEIEFTCDAEIRQGERRPVRPPMSPPDQVEKYR